MGGLHNVAARNRWSVTLPEREGSAALRERFVLRFAEPDLHARLLHRIVLGAKVLDYEEVTRNFKDGVRILSVVMSYEVRVGQIARAGSISGD